MNHMLDALKRNGRIVSTAGYKLCANCKGACRTAWHYATTKEHIRFSIHFVQAIYVYMEKEMGKVQKEGIWFLDKLSEDKN